MAVLTPLLSATPDHEEEGKSKPRTPKYRTTVAHLEDLTRRILAEYTKPDFKSSPLLLRHLDEDFEMSNHDIFNCPVPYCSNRQEHLDKVEAYLRSGGAFAPNVETMSTMVRRGAQWAEVFFTVRDVEDLHGTTVFREGFSQATWKKRAEDGLWMLHRHTSLRGGGIFMGW